MIREGRSTDLPQLPGIDADYQHYRGPDSYQQDFGALGLMANHQRPPPKPKALELQIDSSDSQLPFFEDAPDQDFGASTDHSTV